MFKIISKEVMAHNVKSYVISAPDIAKNAKAGQFVMLRIDDKGERVPLTIAGADVEKGYIRIIFQEAGKTTKHLGRLSEGVPLEGGGRLVVELTPTEAENLGEALKAIGR